MKNTAWGKKKDGSVKSQFATASSFHSGLYKGSKHVTDYYASTVPVYRIAATGVDTITTVKLTSAYAFDDVNVQNSGDGTVLTKSAGLGTPTYLYPGVDHTALVSNNAVITRIKNLISTSTGVTAASSTTLCEATDQNSTVEWTADQYENMENPRGWVIGMDNRRIQITCDMDTVLYCDGVLVDESHEKMYTTNGDLIGSVWTFGEESGKKVYSLQNRSYTFNTNGYVKIQYINAGYYDQIVEYDTGNIDSQFVLGDYDNQSVTCTEVSTPRSVGTHIITPSRIYSATELAVLNQD